MNRGIEHSTWVEVDLGAISNNVQYIKEKTGAEVMAVVKANGYGHGALAVSRAAIEGGASWLAVARVEEALELRNAGIQAGILILGYTPPDRLEEIIQADVSMTIWNGNQHDLLAALVQRQNKKPKVHLKVDTGMSRLGIALDDALDFVAEIHEAGQVQLEGLYTHFACADDKDQEVTDHQLAAFNGVLESLRAEDLLPPLIHAANSSATLRRNDAHFDVVRIGLAAYGLAPSPFVELPGTIRPALSWHATLAQVKILPEGKGVSYGHAYRTSRQERIGTIPVGYADGYRRIEGNQVLIRGQFAAVVGRVTMDQVMVNLDGIPDAQVGDEVVLIGTQDDHRIDAADLAELWGTIPYEVLCGICARVPREYIR
jgi:alanine racemase